MKIIQLTAENIKKLKAVDITPTKDFIQITGANGAGKSSVLDSIWWALAGKDAIQDQPIRQGEEKAIIKLNLGDMIVTRRFTQGGTSLVVENADGFRAASPQALLDTIIGHLTFDPLEFSRMAPKQQFETLRKIADVKIDFEAMKKEHVADSEARRDINRDMRNLEGELDGIRVDDTPVEFVSVIDLMKELSDIEDRNILVMEKELKRKERIKKAADLKSKAERLADELAQINGELHLLNKVIEEEDLREMVYESTDPIKAKIASAEAVNSVHALKQRKEQLRAKIDEKLKASDGLTAKIEKRTADIKAAVLSAKMPIDGLSLEHDAVIFNSIPFAQLSSSEQLRVSIAIAMAANPKLKIIRIKDGSLLDDASLKMIQKLSGEREYQVWVENISTTGKVGIYMEDGAVAANNYEDANVKKTKPEKKS